jgi:hypothetical protein
MSGCGEMLNRDRRRLELIERRMATLTNSLNNELLSDQQSADSRLEKAALEEKDDLLSQRVLTAYGNLLLHEKPKLQSIEVKGDPRNPLNMKIDLSALPDEDLHALARILPKLGGAIGPDAATVVDASSSSRRTTSPQGKPRAGRGRA